MKVLVTGGTGLLGNNLVRQLVEQGVDVRALVRPPRDRPSLRGLDIELFSGDASDFDSIRSALRGVDVVIHSAAQIHIGWMQRDEAEQVNVTGTRNLSAAVQSAGVRMIYISTVDTLPSATDQAKPIDENSSGIENPPITYVATKKSAERVVRKHIETGMDAVIIHPGFMVGPWDWKPSSGKMMLSVSRGLCQFAPWGGCSVCDPRDVASGIINAISDAPRGEHYIMAGENISYLALWRKMAELTGARGPFMRLGPVNAWIAGHFGDAWATFSGREPEVNSGAIRMGNLFHYYSSEKARAKLNYQSRPVDESLADAWQWFQEHVLNAA